MRRPTRRPFRGRLIRLGLMREAERQPLRRGSGGSMYTRKAYATREAPRRGRSDDQLEAREGQAGRPGVAERFVVPLKLGNAGGGEGPGDWATYQLRMCSETADGVARESEGVKSCPRAGCGKSACPVR